MSDIDLSAIEITNEEFASQAASTSLQIMDFLTTLNRQQAEEETAQVLGPLQTSIASLSESSSPEIIDKAEENLKALDTLRNSDKYTKGARKGYKSTLDTTYLAFKDTIEASKARVALLDQVNEKTDLLYSELEDKGWVKDKKLFTEDSLSILKDIQNTDIAAVNDVTGSELARIQGELSNKAKEQKAIEILSKIDAEKAVEGLQVDLTKYNAGSAKAIAEGLGLATLESEDKKDKVDTYYLPEDMRVALNSYDDVKAFFKTWEAHEMDAEVKKLYEDKTRSLEVIKDWMYLGDGGEQTAALAIAHELFGDKDDVNPAENRLNELIDSGNPIGDRYEGIKKDLENLKKEGLHDAEFRDLQDNYISFKLGQDKLAKKGAKTAQELPPGITGPAEFAVKAVNQSIGLINAELSKADRHAKIPEFSKDVENMATTAQVKGELIKAAINMTKDEKGFFSWPTYDEPLLDDLQARDPIIQGEVMLELVEKYLTADGTGLKRSIDSVFDSDNNRRQGFIEVLKAYYQFNLLDPQKINLNDRLIQDLQRLQGSSRVVPQPSKANRKY